MIEQSQRPQGIPPVSSIPARPQSRWFWQRSLRSRILVTYGALLLVTLIIMVAYVSNRVYDLALEQAEHDLEVSAFLIANALEDPLSGYPQALQQYGVLEVDDKFSPDYSEISDKNVIDAGEQGDGEQGDGEQGDDGEESADRDLPLAQPLPFDEPKGVSVTSFQTFVQHYTRSETARVSLISVDGNVIADSIVDPTMVPNQREMTEVLTALAGSEQHEIRMDPTNQLLTLYAAAPVQQGNHLLGVVRLARPMSEVMRPTELFLLNLVLGSLVALIGAIVIGIGLSRYLVRPLQTLEETAQRIAQGQWELNVPAESADEVGALAVTFNTMVNQLRTVIEKQRHFVANASHELRTPLTNIKLRSEAVLEMNEPLSARARRYITEIDSEADRLRRLANTLLNLASAEQQATTLPTEPVDIAPLLLESARSFRMVARNANLTLVARIPVELCPIFVFPDHVMVIVNNLLDNAVKYTPTDGEIKLLVTATAAGVNIQVKDNGIGIPAEDLPYVFERFYRVDKARSRQSSKQGAGSGAGLGLAIVKMLVTLNRGEIQVDSQPGMGTTFQLFFPAALR